MPNYTHSSKCIKLFPFHFTHRHALNLIWILLNRGQLIINKTFLSSVFERKVMLLGCAIQHRAGKVGKWKRKWSLIWLGYCYATKCLQRSFWDILYGLIDYNTGYIVAFKMSNYPLSALKVVHESHFFYLFPFLQSAWNLFHFTQHEKITKQGRLHIRELTY